MSAAARARRAKSALLSLGTALALGACAGAPARPAQVAAAADRVDVTFDGAPFCGYRPTGGRRPVIWPLFAPSGAAVTRAFPFAQVDGEPRDHPHHESLWFAVADANGVDFDAGDGRIVEVQQELDPARGAVRGVSVWRDAAGREVARDFHRVGFAGGDGWRIVDLDVTVMASNGGLRLGGRAGTLGLRLHPALSLRSGARARTADGREGAATFGARSRWVACSGEFQGRRVTVAVFDHPQNPGHPVAWNARDYGLLTAQPFAGAAAGETTALDLPAGAQVPFRYRVWIGEGEDWVDRVDDAWSDWVAGG
ncbi:MAG: DUF6807 family protein [Planctomycetota bacterium]